VTSHHVTLHPTATPSAAMPAWTRTTYWPPGPSGSHTSWPAHQNQCCVIGLMAHGDAGRHQRSMLCNTRSHAGGLAPPSGVPPTHPHVTGAQNLRAPPSSCVWTHHALPAPNHPNQHGALKHDEHQHSGGQTLLHTQHQRRRGAGGQQLITTTTHKAADT
jgi:hypothetical protein